MRGVPVQNSDVLRQSKTSIIVFTSLVSAVPPLRGGLSPEEAYSLGTATFRRQKRQNRWMSWPLAMMMYDDFIRRVHKHRTNPNLSMQIRSVWITSR